MINNRHTRRAAMLMLTLALGSLDAASQLSCRTPELAHVAGCLSLQADSLHAGYNYLSVDGMAVTLKLQGDSLVTHVGRTLFSEAVKEAHSRSILEFVERYSLLLCYPMAGRTPSAMMQSDDVRLERGRLTDFDCVELSDAVSIDYDEMRYRLSWRRDGHEFLTLSFPGEFQLIHGTDIIAAEQSLLAEITSGAPSDSIASDSQPAPDLLEPVDDGQHFVRRGGFYLNRHLNGDLYYARRSDGHYALVASADYPAESAANMMLSTQTEGNYTLDVTERLYGFAKKGFRIPLRQWIAYCRREGCRLYFGAETLSASTLRATVLAVNDAENYVHVLTAAMPLTVIGQGEGIIPVQLSCFVPVHNIRNLFADNRRDSRPDQKKR